MTLPQFFQRLIEKVVAAQIPNIMTSFGTIAQSDERTLLSHISLLKQMAEADKKFWPTHKTSKASSWSTTQNLTRQIPGFWDEFKEDDQLRADLDEFLKS